MSLLPASDGHGSRVVICRVFAVNGGARGTSLGIDGRESAARGRSIHPSGSALAMRNRSD